MANIVTFRYRTGVSRRLFTGARLSGSWDAGGAPSAAWSSVVMEEIRDESGCQAFVAKVSFPDAIVGQELHWGVFVDGPTQPDVWGIATEVGRTDSTERTRSFTLRAGDQAQEYFLT